MAKKRKPKVQPDYTTRDNLAAMYRRDRKVGRRPSHISTLLLAAKQRRVANKAARKAKRPVQLAGSRDASTIKMLRKVSRGGKLSAKEKKMMGPMAMPTERLTGKAGVALWNSFAKSGYRAWDTRRAKYGPTGRGKTSAKAKKKKR